MRDIAELIDCLKWYARPHRESLQPNPSCTTCGGTGVEVYEHPHNGSWTKTACDCTQRYYDTIAAEYRCDAGKRAREVLENLG